MLPSTRTSVNTLDSEPRRVPSACCAPTTSVLRRLTRDPVWVRVKKASGWRCTCANAWTRRS
ncbi:hypothetical protein SRIMM317S_04869 [Streptomyces rimosus subsp. rimosus]